MVDTDVSIDGSNLELGTDYLVMYNMGYGVNSVNDITSVQVKNSTDIIAQSTDDGSVSGTPEALRAASLSGYTIIEGTGNAADDLKIQYQTDSETAFIVGKTLIAIPLNDLIEGTHYWNSTSNALDVVTDAAVPELESNLLELL